MKFYRQWLYTISVIFCIGLGMFFRLYHFDDIPFGLHHDGALEALEGIDISQKPLPYKPYSLRNPWLGETLFRYILGAVMVVFGTQRIVIKLVTTTIGICTLPVVWFVATKLLGKSIGFWSLFFLAISGWHIIMGKSVWRAEMLPLTEGIALIATIYLLNTKRILFAVLTGVGIAIAVNTYNAGRIVPIIIFVILFLGMLHNQKDRLKIIKSSIMLGITALIFCIPLLNFAIHHPDVFNSRASYLFVGSRIAIENSLKPLWDNVVRTMGMFNYRAWGDDFFVTEPLLDTPAAQFFVLGILIALYRIGQFPYQIVLSGFLLNLIPGLLSLPNGNRDIGVMPYVYIISGIGAAGLIETIKRISWNRKLIVSTVIASIILLSVFTTWRMYFGPDRREIFGFYPEATILAEYMRPRLINTDFYIIDNYPRDTLTFETYRGGDPYTKHYFWFDRQEQLLSVKINPNKQSVYVMFPASQNEAVKNDLLQMYQYATVETLQYKRFGSMGSTPVAWAITVPRVFPN